MCNGKRDWAHVPAVCQAVARLWHVSKSQQVYRSIPWDSFNGDTWWSLWIREEMKDHLLSKQDSSTVTVSHIPSGTEEWLNGHDKGFCRSSHYVALNECCCFSITRPNIWCLSSHWADFRFRIKTKVILKVWMLNAVQVRKIQEETYIQCKTDDVAGLSILEVLQEPCQQFSICRHEM